MFICRVFVDSDLSAGSQLQLSQAASHHLSRVLRLKAGAPVTLFNGDGMDYRAELLPAPQGNHRQLAACIVDSRPNLNESPLKIHLLQGLSRNDRMDTTIQKSVELGVQAITPLICRHSRFKPDKQGSADRLERKLAHWKQVAISACEQCGRSRIPAIHAPRQLLQCLDQPSSEARIMLQPDAARSLAGLPGIGATPCSLLVGPESGLSAEEQQACVSAGFVSASLGPRVLRTETAAPAAIAILQAIHGDLS